MTNLKRGTVVFITLAILFFTQKIWAQVGTACPLNIDFELGDFTGWKCSIGNASLSGTTNVVYLNASPPTADRHVIITKNGATDPYGGFSLNPPDGSGHAIKLGNSGIGAQAERVSYTFTIPKDQLNFVLTYQYAVVLQDPGHPAYQQPRFTAKVFNVTDSTYITCGSFDYIATANLPGFKPAPGGVIYKDWTAVTLNLAGYQGKQVRLEFTTEDCTASGHFGYAYIDVNTYCSNLIQGTNYCIGSASAVLNGPSGFQTYKWYNADRSKLLATSQNLVISPAPPDGTGIILDVVPYAGFGCPNSIFTTIHALPGVQVFKITNPDPVCTPAVVDITDPKIVKGSDSTLTYTYWADSATTVKIVNPTAIKTTGTYFIKANASNICYDIQPVSVVINPTPVVVVNTPSPICQSSNIDLTNPAIVSGSTAGLTYTYWQDASCTVPVAAPTQINVSGTYYVKGSTAAGCFNVKPVNLTLYPLPVLKVTNPASVCFPATVNITLPAITAGSSANINLSYWKDSLATIPVTYPGSIDASGTYYIKAINTNGCVNISPVKVTVNALPVLVVTNPAPVCYPGNVDLTNVAITAGSTDIFKLTYWHDAKALNPLASPKMVTDSGLYYIKATNSLGCDVIKPVLVSIRTLPVLTLTSPRKKYKPQTTDITVPAITKGSSANLTYSYWLNSAATISLPNPRAVNQSGIYYIKALNSTGCVTIGALDVVVADIPDIKVPTAFTPNKTVNNTLYPFLIGIKTFTVFRIYNKWGNVVYQVNDASPAKGWDGTYKGQMSILDTYTWVAEGYDYVGNLVHRSGNTLLLK